MVETETISIPLTHIYMTAHYHDLVLVPQYNVAEIKLIL